ncbi:uncharacterized protein [Clytia hemisphaerica]|uniref:uncharacterized protein n=1 Tax=Clytia hemisphaerica TaxID=252671 RepID=UPI0034D418B5
MQLSTESRRNQVISTHKIIQEGEWEMIIPNEMSEYTESSSESEYVSSPSHDVRLTTQNLLVSNPDVQLSTENDVQLSTENELVPNPDVQLSTENDVQLSTENDVQLSTENELVPNPDVQLPTENELVPNPRRSKKKCPECQHPFADLPKHLRNEHGWSRTSSISAVGMFGMRKRKEKKTATKYKHYTKICPFPDCKGTTKNPGEHLRGKKHGFKKSDENYKRMIKLFQNYDPAIQENNYKYGSPMKSAGIVLKKKTIKATRANDNIVVLEDDGSDADGSDDESYRNCLEDIPEVQDEDEYEEKKDKEQILDEELYSDESSDENRDDSLHQLITLFENHMVGPYRGRKEKSVKTVSGDVKRALRVMDVKSEKDLSSMIDNDERLLKYVDYCRRKKHLPGTIKTYLGSLMDFMQFLAQCKHHKLNVINIVRTEKLLAQWKKKYNKGDRLQAHKRKADDRHMIITRDQVAKYDEGVHKAKAMSVFASFKENPEKILKRSELTVVREYFMVEIALANGHRSGVSVYMKMSEYEGCYFDEGFLKIPVWDHKTVETYGAAPVHMRMETYENLKIYVDYMRPKLNPTCSEVLVTWGKGPIQDSDPSKAIHKVWSKSGNFEGRNPPKRLTMNHVRKSISTRSRQEKNPHLKEIAALMAHSVKTADMHYDVFEREHACTVGAIEVEKLFRGKGDSENTAVTTPTKRKKWSQNEESTLVEAIESGTPVKEIDVEASPRQIRDKIRRIKKFSTSPVGSSGVQSPSSPLCHEEGTRCSLWSLRDIADLRKFCQPFIEKKKRMNDESISILGARICEKFTLAQIRTRVAYERTLPHWAFLKKRK